MALPETPYSTPSLPERIRTWTRENPAIFIPLFIFILVILGASYIQSLYFRPNRTVTVVGVGSKKVKPEKATVSFSLVYSGTSQADAVSSGENKFNVLLNSVSPFKPAIDKTAYQIVQNTSGTALVGTYQYVNAAKLTVDDPTKMADVVKALYDNGATVVSQPRFIPKDQDKIDDEVRQLAIKDARDRVGQMARAAGAGVGKVVSIQEGGSTGQTGTSVTATVAATDQNQAPNGLGEIDIQSLVTVVYELR